MFTPIMKVQIAMVEKSQIVLNRGGGQWSNSTSLSCIGGKDNEGAAFPSLEVSAGEGRERKVSGNFIDADGSCERRLALSLKGDVADDMQFVSRQHGKGNDNSNSNGLFLMGESFDLFSGLGGKVGARRRLLVEEAGVVKDCIGNA